MHTYIDQAEQIAILNVLEKLELQDGQDDKRAAIDADSKISLDLLQRNFKRKRLIEWIRGKIIALMHLKWIMHFGWVKEPAWIRGEWIGGQTRKRSNSGIWARRVRQNINRCAYNSGEGRLHMRQQQWRNTWKKAMTKRFSPSVKTRLRERIPIFQEFKYWWQDMGSKDHTSIDLE